MPDRRFVFLDLDDTILDFSGNIQTSGISACAPIARACGIDAEALFRSFRATAVQFWADPRLAVEGRRDLIAASARIMTLTADTLGTALSADDALAFSRDYRSLRDSGLALFPGATGVLARLRSEGATLALICNGSQSDQRGKIARFDLAHYFDLIVIEGELGVGKPDERIFRHALGALGASPVDTVMVGDDFGADIAGASALSIPSVWVNPAGAPIPASAVYTPTRIIERLADF